MTQYHWEKITSRDYWVFDDRGDCLGTYSTKRSAMAAIDKLYSEDLLKELLPKKVAVVVNSEAFVEFDF